MKTVTYFDMQLYIPDWAKFIATDDDGTIWCYDYQPNKEGRFWYVDKGNCEHVGYVESQSTLMKV